MQGYLRGVSLLDDVEMENNHFRDNYLPSIRANQR